MRQSFKNSVFNFLKSLQLSDRVMRNFEDLAKSGANKGLKDII
jgi:hypothetical protein